MSWFYNKIIYAFRRYPARMSGYISTITLYLNKEFPLITGLIIPSLLLVITVSEVAQRAEDRKTVDALHHTSDPNIPDSEEIKLIIKDNLYGKAN